MFNRNNGNGEQTYKTNDPQIVVTGQIKDTRFGEAIVFQVNLVFFQLICIVNIPGEGEMEAPVYVKFKVKPPTDYDFQPGSVDRRPRPRRYDERPESEGEVNHQD